MSKRQSIITTILLSLVPYTEQNIQLVFRPRKFFYELEKQTGFKEVQLKRAFSKALNEGLVREDSNGHVLLSPDGLNKIKPYTAKSLSGGASLMVIFDIPENYRGKRQIFRNFLKYLSFEPVQKSVWMTQMDFRKDIEAKIRELNIESFVLVYECSPV